MELSIDKQILEKRHILSVEKIAFVLLYTLILGVFLNGGLSIVFGPVIAALMCYLFVSGYSEEVFATIIVANDALGTILFGKISFPYLLLVFVIVKILYNKAYTTKECVFCFVSLCLLMQLYLMNEVSFRQLVYSFTFIFALVTVKVKRENLDAFMRGVAITVIVIALHACITGGVEFYEQNIYNEEFLRKGILGVGIGDSNYSSFLLNIGLICVWCDGKMPWWGKLIASIPIVYALTLTLSASGLLMLLIVFVFGILLGDNKPKAVVALLAAIIVVLSVSLIYIDLPKEMRIDSVDAYILRMEEKLESLTKGDYDSFTTGRSGLTERYLYYYNNQGPIGYFFGGNKLMPIGDTFSHNTYIDFLIRGGLFGALAFFGWVAFEFFGTIKEYQKDNKKKRSILLKILCLFIASNLTLADGSLWALWMYFLLLI